MLCNFTDVFHQKKKKILKEQPCPAFSLVPCNKACVMKLWPFLWCSHQEGCLMQRCSPRGRMRNPLHPAHFLFTLDCPPPHTDQCLLCSERGTSRMYVCKTIGSSDTAVCGCCSVRVPTEQREAETG